MNWTARVQVVVAELLGTSCRKAEFGAALGSATRNATISVRLVTRRTNAPSRAPIRARTHNDRLAHALLDRS